MSETNNSLKPCPFCGSTNVELRAGAFWNGAVHCNDCTADVVFAAVELIAKGDRDWQSAVTEGWNKRPYDDCFTHQENKNEQRS